MVLSILVSVMTKMSACVLFTSSASSALFPLMPLMLTTPMHRLPGIWLGMDELSLEPLLYLMDAGSDASGVGTSVTGLTKLCIRE